MGYRISVDTGGTFTDIVVLDPGGQLHIGKALTTPERIFEGMAGGARRRRRGRWAWHVRDLLGQTDILIYGTTRATNAIVTKRTAKTAFLTTAGLPGHADLQGGRQARPARLQLRLPRPLHPAPPHLRDRRAHRRARARWCCRSTRPGRAR